MNDTEKACIHLRNLKKHPNSAMLAKAKSEIKTLGAPAFEGLTEIQRLPPRKEEQTEDPSSCQQPKMREDHNGRQQVTHVQLQASPTENFQQARSNAMDVTSLVTCSRTVERHPQPTRKEFGTC